MIERESERARGRERANDRERERVSDRKRERTIERERERGRERRRKREGERASGRERESARDEDGTNDKSGWREGGEGWLRKTAGNWKGRKRGDDANNEGRKMKWARNNRKRW